MKCAALWAPSHAFSVWLEFVFRSGCGEGASHLNQAMMRSRVDSGGRTTLPSAVRRALDLRKGNELAYRIEAGQGILSRADRPVTANPFVALAEMVVRG